MEDGFPRTESDEAFYEVINAAKKGETEMSRIIEGQTSLSLLYTMFKMGEWLQI